MANVFDVIDPHGRRVFCTEEIWYGKICKKRSYMANASWFVLAAEAVRQPSIGIFSDADYEDREVYYSLSSKSPQRYIKVVVRFDKGNIGRVITVTPANNGKKGEKLKWPPQKS